MSIDNETYYPLDERLFLGPAQVYRSQRVPMWSYPELVVCCTVSALHGAPHGSLSVRVELTRDWQAWTTLPAVVTATTPGYFALHHRDLEPSPGFFVRLRYETDPWTGGVVLSTGVRRRLARR